MPLATGSCESAPTDAEAFRLAARSLRVDSHQRMMAGLHGRSYAKSAFDTVAIADRFERAITGRPADAIIADVLAAYWAEIATIDRHLATASMDDRNQAEPGPGQHALRRTIVHMIEEYVHDCDRWNRRRLTTGSIPDRPARR